MTKDIKGKPNFLKKKHFTVFIPAFEHILFSCP